MIFRVYVSARLLRGNPPLVDGWVGCPPVGLGSTGWRGGGGSPGLGWGRLPYRLGAGWSVGTPECSGLQEEEVYIALFVYRSFLLSGRGRGSGSGSEDTGPVAHAPQVTRRA